MPTTRNQFRRVVFVVFEGMQLLDLAGPLDVFSVANGLYPDADYETVIASQPGGLITSTAGLSFQTRTASSVRASHDTVIVVGGNGTPAAMRDLRLLASLRRLAAGALRVGSVCSGAFLLAEAGLLDGYRATTHWQWCEALASRYPSVAVETDAIHCVDRNRWTSAGVTAGIDLALAMVSHDLGAQRANEVARSLVTHRRRSGGQSQYIASTISDRTFDSAADADADAGAGVDRVTPVASLLTWIQQHPGEDLSVRALAKRAAMSERNFVRVFQRQTSTTPGAFVETVRLDAARSLLESTDRSLRSIAAATGFGTVETMHRAFRRTFGTTPGQHRTHFQT